MHHLWHATTGTNYHDFSLVLTNDGGDGWNKLLAELREKEKHCTLPFSNNSNDVDDFIHYLSDDESPVQDITSESRSLSDSKSTIIDTNSPTDNVNTAVTETDIESDIDSGNDMNNHHHHHKRYEDINDTVMPIIMELSDCTSWRKNRMARNRQLASEIYPTFNQITNNRKDNNDKLSTVDIRSDNTIVNDDHTNVLFGKSRVTSTDPGSLIYFQDIILRFRDRHHNDNRRRNETD